MMKDRGLFSLYLSYVCTTLLFDAEDTPWENDIILNSFE